MATGYIFTKTGNITKAKHVTSDVVDRVKSISGPVVIENSDASIIDVKQGGGNTMSFTSGQILTIDGSAPAGTMEGILDQLAAVFPDASTSGGSGGGSSTVGHLNITIDGSTYPAGTTLTNVTLAGKTVPFLMINNLAVNDGSDFSKTGSTITYNPGFNVGDKVTILYY